jgi:hypothetical protein
MFHKLDVSSRIELAGSSNISGPPSEPPTTRRTAARGRVMCQASPPNEPANRVTAVLKDHRRAHGISTPLTSIGATIFTRRSWRRCSIRRLQPDRRGAGTGT